MKRIFLLLSVPPLVLAVFTACGGLTATVPPAGDAATDTDTEPTDAGGDADVDADSDADADADTDTDSDSDADTGTAPCIPPDLWDLGAVGPVAGTFTPTYVGVSMDGVISGGDVYDLSFDGVDASAWVIFNFYDAAIAYQCSVIYDASQAASSTAAPAVQSGQTIFEFFSLNLVANTGYTDCPNLSGGFGTTDPRQWVANRAWGVGYGDLVELRTDLQTAVEASAPGTWASDWGPNVMGVFLDLNGPAAVEAGWAFQFDHLCHDITTGQQALAAPNAGPLDAYVGNAGDFVVFNLASLP